MKVKRFIIWNPVVQSPEQNQRWVYLRAIEWTSYPVFISITAFPVAIMFFAWWKVLIVILFSMILWTFIRYKYVSIILSDLGAYFFFLRWIIIPISVIFFIFHQNYFLSALSVIYYPFSSLMAGFFNIRIKTGVIQKMLMDKLELKRQQSMIMTLVSKIIYYSEELTKILIKDFPLEMDFQENTDEYKNKYRDVNFEFLFLFIEVIRCFALNRIKNEEKVIGLLALINELVAENFPKSNNEITNPYSKRHFEYFFTKLTKFADCLEILKCEPSSKNSIIDSLSLNIAKIYADNHNLPDYNYYIKIVSEKLRDINMSELIDAVKKEI